MSRLLAVSSARCLLAPARRVVSMQVIAWLHSVHGTIGLMAGTHARADRLLSESATFNNRTGLQVALLGKERKREVSRTPLCASPNGSDSLLVL